jgi:peptidyl-prolyl cis-trans isomerase B (cyclophilin B)
MTTLTVKMETTQGDIRLTLYNKECPVTCANFVNLIEHGYYDNLSFHRVINDFMVQGGCPLGSGTGGPGYQFEDEVNTGLKHDQGGILSMANAGPGTNGSQFFITHNATPWLDGNHTVFGKIVDETDLAVVNSIKQGDSILKVSVSGPKKEFLESQKERVDTWNASLMQLEL